MIYTYGKNFWMLAISMFLFMTSFNLIIPELNTFMENLGGEKQKGLIYIVFSISAALARPFSGKLSDTIGRKPVMYLGVLFGAVIAILYPFAETILLFLLLRLAHGFCAGFMPTGATALATDILPADRRGQGMGIWGVFVSLGFGAGQYLGSIINNVFGLDNLFLISGGVAVLSGILLTSVKETLPLHQKVPFSFGLLRLKWEEIIDPSVRPSAIVMFLSATCSGFIFVLTPDLAQDLEISNKGTFFLYYSISTILVRLFTSSLSDRIGRRKTLVYSMLLLIVSMVMVGTATSPLLFQLSALIFGVATGISSPTLMAWMADLSHPEKRGVGSGTLYIALEIGFIFGAGVTLLSYDNTFHTMFISFILAAFFALLALIYLLWHLARRNSVT